MAVCRQCNQRLALLERKAGICFACVEKKKQAERESREQLLGNIKVKMDKLVVDEPPKEDSARLDAILLTTESSHQLDVTERLEIITAECVLGMNIFKDIGSAFRDLVGGRNEAYQTALKDARKTVLLELKREAAQLGADAVVAVDLDYSEISGGGKSMLFIVASGTAVRLAPTKSAPISQKSVAGLTA